ncbi:MAG: D-2-hydroxyacid dehydrogenase [Clostridia bacterium]|nr:D-2-hydroxyacid dehydrogenase [Clostridia bacterium]
MAKLLLTDCGTLTQNNDLDLTAFSQFGTVVSFENLSGDDLLREVADADIILCNKTPITKAVMDAAPNLKYIGLFATGYNNIDTQEAARRGIPVCNAGSYSTSAVAQQVFAYILSHYSAVEKYADLVRNGGWIDSPTFSMLCCPTDELKDKTIGIIGYGSIGKRVAKIALAFEMNVLVCTRTPQVDENVTFVKFDELLQQSDISTVHCPLTPQSAEMFDEQTFAKCKDGAFFINTARGGIVNEPALTDALKGGKLSGAAVDVLKTEPMTADCVLQNAPNIIITPHTGWAPLATRQRLIDIVVDNLKAFISGIPKNVVNF